MRTNAPYMLSKYIYIAVHQHCTDEAQKAETVLSAVSYIYIAFKAFTNDIPLSKTK